MSKETTRFTLRLPKETKQRLEKESTEIGVSLNALVVQVLWEWVNKLEQGR